MLPGDTPQQLHTAAGTLDQTAQFKLPAPVPFRFCFRCRAGIKIVSASIHLQRDEKHTVKYQHGRLNGSGPRMRENADTRTPVRDKSDVTFFRPGTAWKFHLNVYGPKAQRNQTSQLLEGIFDTTAQWLETGEPRPALSTRTDKRESCSAGFPIKSLLGTLQRALRRIRWPLLKMYPFS